MSGSSTFNDTDLCKLSGEFHQAWTDSWNEAAWDDRGHQLLRLAENVAACVLDEAGWARPRCLKVAAGLLADPLRHDALRAVAALIVGKFGDVSRRRALADAYKSVSEYVQLATYFASRSWPLEERVSATKLWSGRGPLHRLMAKGLASLRGAPRSFWKSDRFRDWFQICRTSPKKAHSRWSLAPQQRQLAWNLARKRSFRFPPPTGVMTPSLPDERPSAIRWRPPESRRVGNPQTGV